MPSIFTNFNPSTAAAIMEQRHLPDEEIEQAVTQFIELLCFPFRQLKPGEDPKPIFALMLRALEDPEGLKRDLIAHARSQDPEKIKADISALADMVRSPRKFIADLVKDSVPAGTPGKRPQITEAKEQQMIQLGRSLLPAAEALIHLRQSATKRSIRDSVEYLAADFPEQAQLLLAHLNAVESFFSQKITQPKSSAAKSKKLVFQVLAMHFGITASYAERWLSPSLKNSQRVSQKL
ncbi:MAG TPA: hypothetical protein VGK01_15150 [Candidatus Angelobacter sp.]